MSDDEPFQRANSAALRLLSYRPRSEAELRLRLGRRFPSQVVESVVESLVERGHVDDAKFASLWRSSRDSLNPKSAAAVKRELIEKGVAKQIADETVADMDDGSAAYRAASRRARQLERADYDTFRRRLWAYLQRRGFSASVARSTVSRLWDERDQGDAAGA